MEIGRQENLTAGEQRSEALTEMIGGVVLDYALYPGEDLYCDGDVEEELLSLVKSHEPDEFEEIIRERKDWPTLYHLSGERGNIIDWIPFDGTEKVLEIGAGPGAITGTLARKVREVTCVDLSRTRSRINAYRNRAQNNITIRVGNFEDIEPQLPDDYDYILLIGVFEYSTLYIHDTKPFHEELRRILLHLKKGGRIVIAIENRLGLKYFAGCREDHTGKYFDGIEGYPDESAPARTFSRAGLEQIFADCGVREYHFYYPYPDYKFMTTLYSDLRLPKKGELTENIRNFDRDRLLLFDEKRGFDALIGEGMFPAFSNSYEVVIGPPLPVSYCKFSGQRSKKYAIRTELREEAAAGDAALSERVIVKTALTKEAQEHVKRLSASCKRLTERFEGSGLAVASCRINEDAEAVFPLIPGRTLTECLDERIVRGDAEGFRALLQRYLTVMSWSEETAFADLDMTFNNILVQDLSTEAAANDAQKVSDAVWTAIDYEWAKEEAISGKKMLGRALACYFREDPARRAGVCRMIMDDRQPAELDQLVSDSEPFKGFLIDLGITTEDLAACEREEDLLQERITEGCTALGELRAQIGGKVIVPAELQAERPADDETISQQQAAVRLATVQIYMDTGNGFSEENSQLLPQHYGEEGVITFRVEIPESVRQLRVDPALCPCIASIRGAELTVPGSNRSQDSRTVLSDATAPESGSMGLTEIEQAGSGRHTALLQKYVRANGIKVREGTYVFATGDPNFVWDMNKLRRRAGIRADAVLTLTIQMAGIPQTLSDQLQR